MAPRNDSSDESLAYPDDSAATEDLPGELLGEDLVDPEPYAVAPEESEAEELEAEAASDEVDASQLTTAEVAARAARSSRPRRRDAGSAEVARKGVPTPRARGGRPVSGARRTTPAQFVTESAEELRKVVWPTWLQVRQFYAAVLTLVLVVIAFVGVLDLVFGWALLKLFG